jgi:hypothetical protein
MREVKRNILRLSALDQTPRIPSRVTFTAVKGFHLLMIKWLRKVPTRSAREIFRHLMAIKRASTGGITERIPYSIYVPPVKGGGIAAGINKAEFVRHSS